MSLAKKATKGLMALLIAVFFALGLAFVVSGEDHTAFAESEKTVSSLNEIQEALNSVDAGGTVKLEEGTYTDSLTLTVNQNVTLDLNGQTITGKVTVNSGTGTLTIISSQSGGKITGSSTDYAIENHGSLILGARGGADANLTVDNADDGGSASAIINENTLTIESGTYTHYDTPEEGVSKSCNAVKNEDTATKLTINGGIFNGVVLGYNTVEISGGTFKADVYNGNQGVENDASLTITGGKFESRVSLYGTATISGEETTFENQVHVYGTTTVNGGKFNYNDKNVNCFTVDTNDATAIVNGGTFASQIQTWGALTVNGGEFEADIVVNTKDYVGKDLQTFDNAHLDVHGGTFHDNPWVWNGQSEVVPGAIVIEPDEDKTVQFTSSAALPDASYFADPSDYPVASEDGGYVSGDESHPVVAYIGNVGYSGLADALENAKSSESVTVTLAANENGDFTIANGKNITLDLGTFSITGTGKATTIKIEQGASLTILGDENSKIVGMGGHYVIENHGTLVLGNADGTRGEFTVNSTAGSGSSSTIENQGTLTINGGTYNNQNNPVLAAIKNEPNRTLTINGGVFDGQVQGYGTVIVEKGTFNAPIFSEYYNSKDDGLLTGSLTIKDGEFNANVYSFNKLTIEGGTFHADVRVRKDFGNDAPKATIEGGTFEGKITGSKDNDEFYEGLITIDPAEGKTVTFTKAENLPNSQYFTNKEDVPVLVGGQYVSGNAEHKAVAYIGNVGYESLQAALDAVAESDITVVLAADATGDFAANRSYNFTLDLNGHTITGADDTKNATLTVSSSTTLTIISSKENGKITGSSNYYVILNEGTLTLGAKGGADANLTVENKDDGPASTIDNHSILTIESGTYNHNAEYKFGVEVSCNAVKNESEATLTVNGGTFSNVVLAYGTTTINGGTFVKPVTGGNHLPNPDGKNTSGKLTIKGGDFQSLLVSYEEVEISGEPTFERQVQLYNKGTISGGTFATQGDVTVALVVGKNDETTRTDPVTITGGTFNKQVRAMSSLTIEDGNFNDVVARRDSGSTGTVSVKGGTFNGKISAYGGSGEEVIEGAVTIDPDTENGKTVKFTDSTKLPDASYFADPTDIPVLVDGSYVSGDTSHPVVAYIDNVGYETLQAAINATNTNDTIVLAADTEEDISIELGGKTLTLVINAKLTNKTGHTISVSGSGTLNLKGTGQVDNVSHGKAALYVGQGATVVVGDAPAWIALMSLSSDKLSFTRSQEKGNDGKANGNSYYTIENHGNLTINDAEVMSTEDGAEHLFSSLIANKTTAGVEEPTLTIKGGSFGKAQLTVKTEKDTKTIINGGDFAGQVKDMGETTITGGNFHDIVFAADEGDSGTGKLTISGGTFDENAQVQALGATVTVSGGTFEGGVVSIKDTSKTESKPSLTITGGEFRSKVAGYEYDPSADGNKFTEKVLGDDAIVVNPAEDKTITFTGAEYIPDAAYFADKEDIPVQDGSNYVSGDSSKTPVAMVGSVGYTELQAAIDAANGGTVTLLADHNNGDLTVKAGNTVTLDLGTFSITGTGTASTILVEQNASLTILGDSGSKIEGKGGAYVIENHGTLVLGNVDGTKAEFTINSAANGGKSSSTIANKTTEGATPSITIYGGTYQNNNTPKLAAIKNEPNTTLFIHGGVFEQQLQLFGTATISKGTFNDIVFSDSTPLNGVVTAGDVTVNGGTFTSFYAFGKATITGGTFSGNVYAFTTDIDGNAITSSLTITNGKFNGNVDVVDYKDKKPQDVSGMLTVSGGTITEDAFKKMTSSDLEIEKVVVKEGSGYAIKDKNGATDIYLGRSTTAFDAESLHSDTTNNSRVCYRTGNGAGDWLVVTFAEFKEIAKQNIEDYKTQLINSKEYNDPEKKQLDDILDDAKKHIDDINYVDGVQGVQEINTHLATAKANMDAVLNKELADALIKAKTEAVEEIKKYLTDTIKNEHLTESHKIVKAEIEKINNAKTQEELAVVKEAAKSAILAFSTAIETAVNDFQLYAVSHGVDLNGTHSDLNSTHLTALRSAEDYADLAAKLTAAKGAIDTAAADDATQAVTNRKASAVDELKAHAKAYGFETEQEQSGNFIQALTDGINKINDTANTTLEQVNAALATAKENITKFYNAIENAVVLVTNYAVSNGIEASQIETEIAAIRAAKLEGTQDTDENSILKAVAAAKAQVDKLVGDNVTAALNARKTSATKEVDALDDDYPDDSVITGAVTTAKSEITSATTIDEVNAAVEKAKATVALQVAKLNAIKDLDTFKTDRFTTEPTVYSTRKGEIESATTVEQVNELRGLALAELTDFHNALLAAEARARAYLTTKGLSLTGNVPEEVDPSKDWGTYIHDTLWAVSATNAIETAIASIQSTIDSAAADALKAAKTQAQESFVTWVKGLNTTLGETEEDGKTPKQTLVKNQYDAIGNATDLTDLASVYSSAQNAVQNLYNAIKRAESELYLYALRSGLDVEKHAADITKEEEAFYAAESEAAVLTALEKAKSNLSEKLGQDLQAAKDGVEDYLKDYVTEMYDAKYVADGTSDEEIMRYIEEAKTSINDTSITTFEQYDAKLKEVTDQIDLRIAKLIAVDDINKQATSYEHDINQGDGTLYKTYEEAILDAATVEAVEVARAAALVAIENFHEAIERDVIDFEAYATSQGFDLSTDVGDGHDDCRGTYTTKLRAAKDYYDLDSILRDAKAAIDAHVTAAGLEAAIKARKESAEDELTAFTRSLGFTVVEPDSSDGDYDTDNIDPYKSGITAIRDVDETTGSVDEVNTALATARDNVTALYNKIQSALNEYQLYALQQGIDYTHSFTDHIGCQEKFTNAILGSKNEGKVTENLTAAKEDVDAHVKNNKDEAIQARKTSALAEVAAMGTKYNTDSKITEARNTATGKITAATGDTAIETINAAVEEARTAIDLRVAQLDAIANLDAYVSEHFAEATPPESLATSKTTIEGKESIGEVNSAYTEALSALTSFYNALVDAEARARSYAMTNGFDLSAEKEKGKTWDAYIHETLWAATKTGGAETEGTIEHQFKAIQDAVDGAAKAALNAAITEAQSSFASWAANLNPNFKTNHTTYDTQYGYIGDATSLTDLASRLSNAQNAMQNLYNAMKNAAEAVRLYAFINGIDPDDEDGHKKEITPLIEAILKAADEKGVNDALSAAKTKIDELAVDDEEKAVETARSKVKDYLEQYVKNTYGATDGGEFLKDTEVSKLISDAATDIKGKTEIDTAKKLEEAMREVIEKIDTRIAQIKALEELESHAATLGFDTETEDNFIDAYKNGRTAIEAADASVEAVATALAEARANVTAFYNAILNAEVTLRSYADSQGVDITKAYPNVAEAGADKLDEKLITGSIQKATSDKDLSDKLSAAKGVIDKVRDANTKNALEARKTTAKAELKRHAESLGFTINDDVPTSNITAYYNGINAINGIDADKGGTIDAVNSALEEAKSKITKLYNAIETALRDFEVYALRKGVNFDQAFDEGGNHHDANCKQTLIDLLRGSKDEGELETNITTVNNHVDKHVAHNEAKALQNRKDSAKKELQALGEGHDTSATINDADKKSIQDLLDDATDEIDNPDTNTLDKVNEIVDKYTPKINLLIAKLDAIKELDQYAATCGFKKDNKNDAWTNGTSAIESATSVEDVNAQRELALLAITAFQNELLNAEVTARAYATSNGIDLNATDIPEVSGKTWSAWIKETLWAATNSTGIDTQLETVTKKINDAANAALQETIAARKTAFATWAHDEVDNRFNADHALVKAQVAIFDQAESVEALNALYAQAQTTVKNVKAAMDLAIKEINTYALRNGIDVTDEGHKDHYDAAVAGIYAAATEAEVRGIVDTYKEHIDEHAASDRLEKMKDMAEDMLIDAVPEKYRKEKPFAGTERTTDSALNDIIDKGITALQDEGIKTIEDFNTELDKQLALIALRVAKLEAFDELQAHAASLSFKTDVEGNYIKAYKDGRDAIEKAETVADVEMQLRGALLAVTEFRTKIDAAVADVRSYAVANGVDPDAPTIDYGAIQDAKDETALGSAVSAAKTVIDGLRDANIAEALKTRKATATEELKKYAEAKGLKATIDALTNGLTAIEKAKDLTEVNDALTKAMGEIDVYYNLYIDALLGLRTHSASYGHDLGDRDHTELLKQVTDLLDKAKNATELQDAVKEAKTLLDEHIKVHGDQMELAEHIKDKINDLRFYAIEKGVDLSDEIVREAIKDMQAVEIDTTLEAAEKQVDDIYDAAVKAIDAKSSAEDLAAGLKAVVDALKLYAATRGVPFQTEWVNEIEKQTSVDAGEHIAENVKKAIDKIADLANAKDMAIEDLRVYAAAKDVSWDKAWETTINDVTVIEDIPAAIQEVKDAIDAIANLAAAKKAAIEDLRLYAATRGVAWTNGWANNINGAADEDALEAAVADVRKKIEDMADLADTLAATLTELRLYAAMHGVAWNDSWTELIEASTLITVEENAAGIRAKIDDTATLRKYIEGKVDELRLYALEKGISLSDKLVTDAVAAMQDVTIAGTHDTLELAQALVDERFSAAKSGIDAAAGNNSLASYKQATLEDLRLYAAMKGVTFTAEMEEGILAKTTLEEVAAEAQALRTQIDSAATLASAKAQAESQLRTYAEMMGVAWKDAWTTAITGAANTDAVTAQITAIRSEISAAAALASAKAQAVQELRIFAAGLGVTPDDKTVAAEEAKINAAATVAAVGTALASAKETIKRQAATEGTSAKYLVVFVANGNVVSVQNVTRGGNATQPADPEVYGKIFKGWVGTFTNVTSDLVITADFDEAPNITEAKEDVGEWLDEYLDNILSGVLDEVIGDATATASRTAALSDDELNEKLSKVYSEANAKLVRGYYDEALYYIENAEDDTDVEYAIISFRNNVSAVEILEELLNRPLPEKSSSGVEIAALVIGIIALVCAAAAVTTFLVFRKKTAGNADSGEEADNGSEETDDSSDSDK